METVSHRALGTQGLSVSTIGLGCMSLSGVYGPADDAEFGEPHSICHRSRHRSPRLLRHVRLGSQRGGARPGHQGPARSGRACHEIRPDAARGPGQWRRWQSAIRSTSLRGEPEAAGRRCDRRLLPAPRRSERADRGDRRRDGRPRPAGQGALPRTVRGEAGDDPAGPQSAPDLSRANRILPPLQNRSGGNAGDDARSSGSGLSPMRRSVAAS